MTPEQLLVIHMRLECIRIIPPYTLARFDCYDPDDIHRFYVARMFAPSSLGIFYRWDLDPTIREQLQKLDVADIFFDSERVRAVLAQYEPCTEVFHGKSYVFPTLDSRLFADVRASKGGFEVVIDDLVVSRCESSRENEESAEAWVITQPEFRGRGFARQVTAAWAFNIQQSGRIPFYSHRVENTASEHVAQGLSLVQYIEDIGFL